MNRARSLAILAGLIIAGIAAVVIATQGGNENRASSDGGESNSGEASQATPSEPAATPQPSESALLLETLAGKAVASNATPTAPETRDYRTVPVHDLRDGARSTGVSPIPTGTPTPGSGATSPVGAFFAGGAGAQAGVYAVDKAYYFDAKSGDWTVLKMSTPRSSHTVTDLGNGQVLIAGGLNGTSNDALASAEVFDIATGLLSTTDSLIEGRYFHAAAQLAPGRVLIAGGGVSTNATTAAEIYDASTRRFTSAGRMTESRYGPSATLLLDGRVLIAGGNNSRTAEVFDPRTGAFSRVGDMTAVHGNGHTATRLPSGEVLIVGGFGETAFPVATAELFDPRTNTFRSLGNTLEARRAHVAVLLPNGSVLIRGGFTLEGPTATVERFDPATGRFVREPDMALAVGDNTAVYLAVSAGPKPWPRIDQTLAVNERGVFAPDNRYSVSVEQVELTGAEVRVFIDAQGPADLRDPVTSCIIELGASSATGEKAQRFVSTITEPGRRYKGYLVFRRDFLEYGKQYLLRYSCLPDYSAAALGRIY